MEVDRAIFYAMLSKAWLLFAGPVTLYLISLYLSPEVQGFYYTFVSLLALKSFLELGFYIVITQFASHEWAHLKLNAKGFIVGDERSLQRLISMGRLVFKWYAGVSIAFMVLVGFGGYLFLSQAPDPGTNWVIPWFAVVGIAGFQLWALPFISLLEGCNQVKNVNLFRLVEAIVWALSIWLTMYLGKELWMIAAGAGAMLLTNIFLLLVYYRNFFKPFYGQVTSCVIDWKVEMWPMQWRIAIGGVANYFLFSLYTPILFNYHGAVVAGQMGMAWQLVLALSSVAMVFINTKVPRFGILIAHKNYKELDRFFFRSSLLSIFVMAVGALLLWFAIYSLNNINPSLAKRVLDPLPMGLFLIGAVLGQVSACQSSYLRAHKKEPYLKLNIIYSLINGLLVWYLAKDYGALGASIGYLLAMCFVCIPFGTLLWIRCRKEWH